MKSEETKAKPRLLYVEDNAEIRQSSSGILADWFDVTEAADGLQALRLASEIHPDAIITDHHMPGFTGETLIKVLRQDRDFRNVPIVCACANLNERQALRAGATAYFRKPCDFNELAEATLALVNEAAPSDDGANPSSGA